MSYVPFPQETVNMLKTVWDEYTLHTDEGSNLFPSKYILLTFIYAFVKVNFPSFRVWNTVK